MRTPPMASPPGPASAGTRSLNELPLPLPVNSLKVVAFDCDGVLFDSKEANILFYNVILDMLGRPPVREDQVEYLHMHSARESLLYLLGAGALYEMAMDHCMKMDFSRFHSRLQCEPGLVAFLESIKPSYGIAMATNRTVSTRDVLEHFLLDHFFDVVVTAADVPRPKPHPDIMERILETFGVSPAEVLYIGDSLVDEEVAAATNVYFAAYKNPKLNAHLHVGHFRELSALFAAVDRQPGGNGTGNR